MTTSPTTTSEDKVRVPPDELRSLFLFEHLDDDQLAWVCEHGDVVAVPGGHELVTEGDPAECFYVLLTGALVSLVGTHLHTFDSLPERAVTALREAGLSPDAALLTLLPNGSLTSTR